MYWNTIWYLYVLWYRGVLKYKDVVKYDFMKIQNAKIQEKIHDSKGILDSLEIVIGYSNSNAKRNSFTMYSESTFEDKDISLLYIH